MSPHHVCPWWLAYTFDNPLRRLFHDPHKILADHVSKGMTVMDIGCGMGYFTLGLAELVGDNGKVFAVDLQQEMLDITLKRAEKRKLAHRIMPHRAKSNSINISFPVDFILAFWMVHEVPNPDSLFHEIAAVLRPASKLLYAEPLFHVPEKRFNKLLNTAESAGLRFSQNLSIRFSRATLLENTP